METGYYKLTFTEYSEIRAVNHSLLNAYAKSPAYCKLLMEQPQAATKQMWIGIAAHCLLLEPGQFAKIFAVVHHDGRTKKGIQERELAERQGLVPIREEDIEAAAGMAASMGSHPRVSELMRQCRVEETAVWRMNGELCKARRDCVGPNWIADFKTTADIDKFSPWVLTDMGYHRQAAWYTLPELWLEEKTIETFFFFVVETSAPYESAVFYLRPESLTLGHEQAMANFNGYLKSRETGDWPRHIMPLLAAEAVRKE